MAKTIGRLILGIGMAMAVVVLGGCAGMQNSPLPETTPVTEATPAVHATPGRELVWPTGIDFTAMEGKKITIVPTSYYHQGMLEDTLREEFSQKYGVTIENLQLSEAERAEKPKEISYMAYLYATGRSATVWGYGWGAEGGIQAAARGMVQPVDAWYNPQDTTFIHAVLEANAWRGKHYCLQLYEGLYAPRGNDTMAVVYNASEMQRQGLADPLESFNRGEWTWSKLREASRAMNRYGTNGKPKGDSRGLVMDTQLVASALAVNDAAVYRADGNGLHLTVGDKRVEEMLGILSDGVGAGDFLVRNPSGQQQNLFYDVCRMAQNIGAKMAAGIQTNGWRCRCLPGHLLRSLSGFV
nr:hypothetical protein [bacterium]